MASNSFREKSGLHIRELKSLNVKFSKLKWVCGVIVFESCYNLLQGYVLTEAEENWSNIIKAVKPKKVFLRFFGSRLTHFIPLISFLLYQ